MYSSFSPYFFLVSSPYLVLHQVVHQVLRVRTTQLLLDYLLRWVNQEPSLPLLMEPLGIIGLLEQMIFYMESPTETDSSWRWVIQEPTSPVIQEPSSPLLMEPLGITGLLEHQIISMESPTPNNLPPQSSPASNPLYFFTVRHPPSTTPHTL